MLIVFVPQISVVRNLKMGKTQEDAQPFKLLKKMHVIFMSSLNKFGFLLHT